MYLTQSLHRNAQQHPDRPLTVFGDRTRTTAESRDRIARLAGALAGQGVRAGDRVAMLALNSDRYYEYLYAVPWLGAVLNPCNVRWSVAEIAYSLRDSDTRVLFVDDAFSPLVDELRTQVTELAVVIHTGEAPTPAGMLSYETLVNEADPVPDTRTGGDTLAGIFYTGGTTGAPKGVMLGHDNLVTSSLGSLACGLLSDGGRVLHTAPMFHLADLALWTAGNAIGATHVIVPMFNPDTVLRAIAEHRVTDTLLVPTMIAMLVDHPPTEQAELSSLRRIVYGASPISEAVLDRARRAFPAAGFVQAYGMSELSPIATLLSAEDHRDPALARAAGRAGAHAEVKIVDPSGDEVPRGTVGEVVVRGDNVMLGYWNRPEDTAAAVRDGWMHTGDGGRMDERGYVYIVDRIKDMIITGGENVYSVEVENAVAAHPAVAAVAVIGVPDSDWGERVHAVVVARADHPVTAAEIRDHCKTLIAGYKSPRTVEFVDELPVSGAGKILKRQLRERQSSHQHREPAH